ncbi:MAG: hypothetical protein ABEL76_08330 [Bradymonadaceae bacterium]
MISRTTRLLLATAALALGVGVSSPATALDGYEDRERIFGGVGLGGGGAALQLERGGDTSIEQATLVPGVHATALLGGGITQNVLAAAEMNWWFRNVSKGSDRKWATHHFSVLPVVNVFVAGGLHVDAGGGLAYTAYVGDHPAADLPHQELGFAAEGGLGYEFWLNGTLAAGADIGYAHHFYPNGSFDTVSGAFTLRWY